MRETLRHRPFRRLFLAQCTSFLGDAVFMVALAFAVLEVTGSPAALGTVLASGGALLVLTFLFSGVWADRLPRVRVMVTSDAVRLVTQALLATLLLTDTAHLWHLIALNGLYNMATAFFQPARTALMPQLLDADRLVPANGLMGSAENLMWTIGWALGGILVAAIGPGWVIALDALTFFVSAGLLLSIGAIPTASLAEQRQPFLRELADGWSQVRARRWIWFTLAAATGYLLVQEGPLMVIGPLAMEADYAGARSWGILLAGAGAGATIGAIVAARDRMRRPILVSLWLFFAAALLPVLLLLEAPLWALVACNVVVGAGGGLFMANWDAALQRDVPADKVARVSAWDWMCSLAGMPVGMALAGWLVEPLGRDVVLLAMSIGTFLVCIAFVAEPSIRGMDLQRVRADDRDSERIVP
jgi:MFS family permease